MFQSISYPEHNSTTTTMAIGIFSNQSTLGLGPSVVPNFGHFQQDRFEQLVLRLKEALGPSSGLTSDDVDVDFLQGLMQDYDCSDDKWSKYAFSDRNKSYTRNLVDEGNGKSNLVSGPGDA